MNEQSQSGQVGNGWVIFFSIILFVGGFASHYAFHQDHDFEADQAQDNTQHAVVVDRHDSHDKQFEILGKILVRIEGKIDATDLRVKEFHDNHLQPHRLRGVENETQPAK
jgi:hypothetical protein